MQKTLKASLAFFSLFNFFMSFSNNEELLIFACQIGDIEHVNDLLQQGVNIEYRNAAGLTPLLIACTIGDKELVEFLLDSNANINAQEDNLNFTGLHIAYSFGHMEIVRLLLERGIDKRLIPIYDFNEEDFLNPGKINNFYSAINEELYHQKVTELYWYWKERFEKKQSNMKTLSKIALYSGIGLFTLNLLISFAKL